MDLLDNLISLHETDQRLLEIDELKGDLPSLLIKQKSEVDLLSKNQKSITGTWANSRRIIWRNIDDWNFNKNKKKFR